MLHSAVLDTQSLFSLAPAHCESEPIKSKYKQRLCIKQDPDWLLVAPKNVLIFAYFSTMGLINSPEKKKTTWKHQNIKYEIKWS